MCIRDRREALTPVLNQYDFIFIDCPPSLDLLTLNGLCACDTVSVSYTHLDVYKRQELYEKRAGG